MIFSGDRITVENGRFLAHGVVIGPAERADWIKVEIFRNKIDVPLSQVRLAKMSAQNPWEDAPREMLENALSRQAATIARMTGDNEALLAVIDMQVEAMTAVPPSERPPKIIMDGHGEWYERLIDLLENYLARQLGDRHPLRIADPDLRALVSHILD
jgi:hypothetical protein